MAKKFLEGGAEVDSRRMFVDGGAAILETMGGDYVYMNGKTVDKEEDFNILPEQHKKKALDWLKARGDKEEAQRKAAEEAQAKAKADEELMAFLRENPEEIESIRKRGPGRPKGSVADKTLAKMGLEAR